jgi:hypothetical protein
MRLHDVATPTNSHFQIIDRPQNMGCILRDVENGKGNLIGDLLLLPVSNNYATDLHLVSCGPETWFLHFEPQK